MVSNYVIEVIVVHKKHNPRTTVTISRIDTGKRTYRPSLDSLWRLDSVLSAMRIVEYSDFGTEYVAAHFDLS